MPLEEVVANKVAIPRGPTSLAPAPKRPRRGAPYGHTRFADGKRETDWNVKILIVVARLYYKEPWKQIEERFSSLGVKKSTAASIYMKAWEVEKKDDFQTIVKNLNREQKKRGPQPKIPRPSADSPIVRTLLKVPQSPRRPQQTLGTTISNSPRPRRIRQHRPCPPVQIMGPPQVFPGLQILETSAPANQ